MKKLAKIFLCLSLALMMSLSLLVCRNLRVIGSAPVAV